MWTRKDYRNWREENGLTQIQAAKELELKSGGVYFSMLETGNGGIKPRKATMLACIAYSLLTADNDAERLVLIQRYRYEMEIDK